MDINQTIQCVYAPKYYNEFKCTADKCKHSCCIDWQICIDEETLSKYKKLNDVKNTIIECEDGVCFELDGNGRCPHLNGKGLCNIIISHGEDYLSEICSNHPRFFNHISEARIEAGIGIVCEEACRLILEDENLFSLSLVEEFEDDYSNSEKFSGEFNPLPYRDKIISQIEAFNGSFDEKLDFLHSTYKTCEIYPDEWINRYLSLEILDSEWPKLLKAVQENTPKENDFFYEKYYERLLIYFIYRHVSVAESPVNLRARLAFSVLSVKIIRLMFQGIAEQSLERLIDLARRYSAEIEYCEDNTFEIIFNLERML